ncbi:MAG TPA: DUF4240 domain-containing protein [Pirellulaceae bacterium]|jgi:hypothetical protein|nr:DUF4240 domain-containing protein [Pirellulaceae bacterium]
MNRDEFWRLIESSRPRRDDAKAHVSALVKRLARFDVQQTVAFERHRAFVAKELDSEPLHTALARLVNRPPTEDDLALFCDWLILLGQGAVETAVEQPELLSKLRTDVLPNVRGSDLSGVGFAVLDGKDLTAADRLRWSGALLQDFTGGGSRRAVLNQPPYPASNRRPPHR